MAITKLNSLAIPAGTVEPADISYPLTNFSSTGIDDNASSTVMTLDNTGVYSTQRVQVEATSSSSVELLRLQNMHSSGGVTTNYLLPSVSHSEAFLDFSVAGAYSEFVLGTGTQGSENTAITQNTSGTIALSTNQNERMRIDGSGYVGIGNSAPNYALHIKDTANSSNMRRITIESDSNAGSNAGYRFALDSANGTVRGGGYYFVPGDTDATTYLGLSSTDTDYAMVATRENNIGIGTTNPSRMLHLRDAGSTVIRLEADTDNVTETDIAAIEMSQDGGVSTGFIGLNASNYLVIGANSTTAPNIVFNTAGTGTSYLDGSTGTKMIIHNSGEVTKPSNPAFLARHSSNTATGKIPYNNEVYDVGSNFDTTNNRFTAPVAGYYFFYMHTLTTNAYNGDTRCVFRKNGVQYSGNRHITDKTNWDTSHATALIYCAANDYVEAWFDGLPTNGAAYSDSNYNGFFGFLVS